MHYLRILSLASRLAPRIYTSGNLAIRNFKRCLSITNIRCHSEDLAYYKVEWDKTWFDVELPKVRPLPAKVDIDIIGRVGIVSFETLNSPVNILSVEMYKELALAFKHVNDNNYIDQVCLISKKHDNFFVGSDIELIKALENENQAKIAAEHAQKVLQYIAYGGFKTTVAVIRGKCLGGGLELALCCTQRIFVDDPETVVGFPEPMLGLIPGSSGSFRVAKFLTYGSAMELLTTGKTFTIEQAKKFHFVDHIIKPVGQGLDNAENLSMDSAIRACIKILETIEIAAYKFIHVEEVPYSIQPGEFFAKHFYTNYYMPQILNWLLSRLSYSYHHYPVIKASSDYIWKIVNIGPLKGLEEETKVFAKLSQTPESKNLIGLYYATQKCKSQNYGAPCKVKNVSVLGAGLMGSGIACVSANKAKLNVVVKDNQENNLFKSKTSVFKYMDDKVTKKIWTPYHRDKMLNSFKWTTSYDNITKSDIVIEAVFEDLDTKQAVLQEVEKITSPECIFATNTSAISIAKIAEVSTRPEKVIGMHYFSPVPKMKLLEIVTHDKTSKSTIATALDVGKKQGKTCIVIKDSPGFYTTRILTAVLSEGLCLLKEGYSPFLLNKLSLQIGFPVGFIKLIDEIGLDVCLHILKYMGSFYPERFPVDKIDILEDLVKEGYLGKKSGAGIFYHYPKFGIDKVLNFIDMPLIYSYPFFKLRYSLNRIQTSDSVLKHLEMRIMSRLINEAVFCLQEGVISSPNDGDVGAVLGFGFPPFTGGPFRYVDQFGAENLVNLMEKLQNNCSETRFQPAKMLIDHATTFKKFYAN